MSKMNKPLNCAYTRRHVFLLRHRWPISTRAHEKKGFYCRKLNTRRLVRRIFNKLIMTTIIIKKNEKISPHSENTTPPDAGACGEGGVAVGGRGANPREIKLAVAARAIKINNSSAGQAATTSPGNPKKKGLETGERERESNNPHPRAHTDSVPFFLG